MVVSGTGVVVVSTTLNGTVVASVVSVGAVESVVSAGAVEDEVLVVLAVMIQEINIVFHFNLKLI